MKKRLAMVLLGGLGLGLIFGLQQLFHWRLSSGDVFPEYSSLRDDPLGVGVFFDALSQMPEMRVDRNLSPLSRLPETPARTIVLAGTSVSQWSRITRDDFEALNAAVRRGGRLVIAFRAQVAPSKPTVAKQGKPTPTGKEEKPSTSKKTGQQPDDEAEPGKSLPDYVDLQRSWGAKPKGRWLMQSGGGAIRSSDAAASSLPDRIPWASDTIFELDPKAGWRVLYRRGGAPVLVERGWGSGTIVLAGDSYFLSNEALQRDRGTPLLSWIVGPPHHVTFDESHLGVVSRPGVAALARRYGLWPACVSLLMLALLFVWQRSAWFVPPNPAIDEVGLTYHPAAGLHSLLRRAVPPTQVLAASVAEWRSTARESDRQRVDRVLATLPGDASPPESYNALVRALRRR